MILLVALLACWPASEPPPSPPPGPEASEPGASEGSDPGLDAPVSELDVRLDVVVRGDGVPLAGARVLGDARIQELRQGAEGLVWRTTRRLSPAQHAEVRRLAEDPGLVQLPERLPSPAGLPPSAPEATWRIRQGDTWKAWRIPGATLQRVSPFADIEAVLREGAPLDLTVSRWTVVTPSRTWSFELACDPREVAAVRGLAAHLRDPGWPTAPEAPPGAERLAIGWSRGLSTLRTTWLADGRVVSTGTDGRTHVARLPPEIERRVSDAWTALDPAHPPRCPDEEEVEPTRGR